MSSAPVCHLKSCHCLSPSTYDIMYVRNQMEEDGDFSSGRSGLTV
mgnify:CR=1 FL=1